MKVTSGAHQNGTQNFRFALNSTPPHVRLKLVGEHYSVSFLDASPVALSITDLNLSWSFIFYPQDMTAEMNHAHVLSSRVWAEKQMLWLREVRIGQAFLSVKGQGSIFSVLWVLKQWRRKSVARYLDPEAGLQTKHALFDLDRTRSSDLWACKSRQVRDWVSGNRSYEVSHLALMQWIYP